jgi:3-phenylpropionate/trans-cinnamate dioxygenase ferredoxin reductase subunit
MGRIVPKEISTIVRKKHEENGVDIHLRTNITSIKKNTDNYTIQLSNNASVICNMIIVGIGAIPNVEIFDNTALKIDNGIITNQYNKTSIENVFAAGDVSNFYHPLYEENIRLESWKHAQNHGVSAGKNIVGQKTEYSEVPWMWSDQYNLNLQLTGRCDEYDSLVKRGKDENDGIIYFFMKNNQVFGACGVGIGGKIAKDIRIAGILSDKKIKVAESDLSDSSIKLNKLLKKI